MKFAADAMLGRLAKWMRIMGCDVSYYPKIDDSKLIDLAAVEGRLILTKDNLLIRRRRARDISFLIQGNSYKEQLKQVARYFSIDPYEHLLTRCIECNASLIEIEKEKVKGAVQEYVYSSESSFSRCPACGKIYWSATHKRGIINTLKEIFNSEQSA